MIAFAPLRTRRLEVRLKELSIGDEIDLCNMPLNAHEKALSELLARAIESAETPSARHVADPRAWTVSERLFALAHYCSHAREDAPDYAVTDVSKLSDYLDASRDLAGAPVSFTAIGDEWILQPLTGAAAEAIETLQVGSSTPGRAHWMFGMMAAQLQRVGDTPPDPVVEASAYVAWLRQRIAIVRGLPSTSVDQLYAGYRAALAQSTQFFRLWFDGEGVVVLPKEAGAATPPARFLASACIGTLALSLTGKP